MQFNQVTQEMWITWKGYQRVPGWCKGMLMLYLPSEKLEERSYYASQTRGGNKGGKVEKHVFVPASFFDQNPVPNPKFLSKFIFNFSFAQVHLEVLMELIGG